VPTPPAKSEVAGILLAGDGGATFSAWALNR